MTWSYQLWQTLVSFFSLGSAIRVCSLDCYSLSNRSEPNRCETQHKSMLSNSEGCDCYSLWRWYLFFITSPILCFSFSPHRLLRCPCTASITIGGCILWLQNRLHHNLKLFGESEQEWWDNSTNIQFELKTVIDCVRSTYSLFFCFCQLEIEIAKSVRQSISEPNFVLQYEWILVQWQRERERQGEKKRWTMNALLFVASLNITFISQHFVLHLCWRQSAAKSKWKLNGTSKVTKSISEIPSLSTVGSVYTIQATSLSHSLHISARIETKKKSTAPKQ